MIKKMRRKKIGTHEQANLYLQQEYLPEHNQRFTCVAAEAGNYHRRRPGQAELEEVFRLESERSISNDWVVRYDNRFFQLRVRSRNHAPAKGKVEVCQWQGGRIEIACRGRKLVWREIASAPLRPQTRTARPALFRVAVCALP